MLHHVNSDHTADLKPDLDLWYKPITATCSYLQHANYYINQHITSFYCTNKHDNKYCYFIETIRFKLWHIECCQVQARLIVNQLMTEQIITAVRHHHIKESHGKNYVNNLQHKKLTIKYLSIWTEVHIKANIVDPDQRAPNRSTLIRVCNICHSAKLQRWKFFLKKKAIVPINKIVTAI